ncbi:MAG: oligosaccharide flippase family protein [Clostridia bacterium]|nr:oligosaccharide flippase family protein [Clostridia bacterium]
MKGFFKTVAIVTVFSISEKFLGFLYRIFLSHSIGAEGIGIYQVALSVFGLLFTLCCSGVPVTVSRLMTKYKTSDDKNKVAKLISAGLALSLFCAVVICALVFLLGDNLGFLFADKRSFSVFKIIIPGLIFTSVYSVLRGVFWGNKDFLPYSIIELLEEVCMIIFGVILICFASDVTSGATNAGIAVLISYLFSFTLGVIVFFLRKNRIVNPKGQFSPLLKSAVPITAMRTANSLAVSLVSIILPIRLVASGLTKSQAMSAFGAAVGQALPVLFIPTNLISSFTLVLIPEISENFYAKKHFYLKRDVEKAIKTACISSLIFVPLFAVCGDEIGVTLFGSALGGEYLSASCFLVTFMSLSSITTGILNSMGLETKTLIYYAISGVVMLGCIWVLPAFCGVYSLLIGFGFIYLVTTLLNLRLINKNCVQKPKYVGFMVKGFLLAIPCIIFGFLIKKLVILALGNFFTLVVCGILTVGFYLALMVGFNLINFEINLSKLKSFIKIKKPTT